MNNFSFGENIKIFDETSNKNGKSRNSDSKSHSGLTAGLLIELILA